MAKYNALNKKLLDVLEEAEDKLKEMIPEVMIE